MTAIQNPYSGGGGSSLPTPVSVPNGGTGDASLTAYALMTGGTNSTNPMQQVSGVGTAQFVLASAGAAALPVWQPPIPPVVALTDAATILVDASLGTYFTVQLGGSRTMDAPSNPVNAQYIEFQVQQPSSAGPDTVTWTSGAGGYSFGSGSAPTLSTANSAVDCIGFRYSSVVGKWLYQGSQLGFS